MSWDETDRVASTTCDGDLLGIGDKVSYDGYSAGGSGVVVERLASDYVRVLWSDCIVPMTHRIHSLRRETAFQPWQPQERAADEVLA